MAGEEDTVHFLPLFALQCTESRPHSQLLLLRLVEEPVAFLLLAHDTWSLEPAVGDELRAAVKYGTAAVALVLRGPMCPVEMLPGRGYNSLDEKASYSKEGLLDAVDGIPAWAAAVPNLSKLERVAFEKGASELRDVERRLLRPFSVVSFIRIVNAPVTV